MIIFRLTLLMSDSSSEHDTKISLPLNYTQQLGRKMCLLFHIHEKKEIQSFQRVWVSFIRLNPNSIINLHARNFNSDGSHEW